MERKTEKANTCQNCREQFIVDLEDLKFLEKVSPTFGGRKFLIPPPTLCPECRQQRRMSFRNERNLHRRKCDVTGRDIISVFSPDSQYKVCEKNFWNSDAFDPLSFGRDYDFNVPFFQQFKNLLFDIPLPSLRIDSCENCEFNNDISDSSNCYLCARTHVCQNMLYAYRGNRSNDCVDCMQVTKCSHLYNCVECSSCQDSQYLYFCTSCATSSFLLDCRNCFDCLMCSNLRNKQYCFMNEQLSKQAYLDKLHQFDLGSHRIVEKTKELFSQLRQKAIRSNLSISSCENVSGDNLSHSRRLHHCFGVQDSEDGRYLWDVKNYRDAMDAYGGGRGSELIYETASTTATYNIQFCLRAFHSQYVRYSFFINYSSNIFGSIGLRRAKYCVLNKRYSQEEYEQLIPRIIEHMQSTGEWGEFFPPELSPFAYNETVAHEFFPLTKERALDLGYRWLEPAARMAKEQIYKVPDTIEEVKEEVTGQTLSCRGCRKNFKIVQQELAYYRRHRIPLPLICVDCRYLERLSAKNPMRLRESSCAKCGQNMQTSFPEETDMRIYCGDCYLRELS